MNFKDVKTLSGEEIESILKKYKTIAIVGLSWNPAKESYKVAKYLKNKGYRIIPINPYAEIILGEECYKSLLDVPDTIEIVNIFRSAKDVLPTIDQAIELKKKLGNPRVVWMQLGIVNEKAARRARNADLTVVMDRCIMTEHERLSAKETSSN